MQPESLSGHDHGTDCRCLPIAVVVDQHGHYWRDYGNHWSMCPVSDENVATDRVSEFYPIDSDRGSEVEALAERLRAAEAALARPVEAAIRSRPVEVGDLRWWVEGALERLNDIADRTDRMDVMEVRDWLQNGLAGAKRGLTAKVIEGTPYPAARPVEEGDELAQAKRTIEAMSGDAADLHDLIGEAAAMRTVLGHLLSPTGRIHDSGCGTCDAGRALLTADHELPSWAFEVVNIERQARAELRAEIAKGVEGLPEGSMSDPLRSELVDRAAVLALIRGETT